MCFDKLIDALTLFFASDFASTFSVAFFLHYFPARFKAGFHMIADDRGSGIADRKKFCDRLRSYGNTLLRSSAIVCDPAIVIADDRRRSQTIAEDRTTFYLRSSAINCDRAIIWKPKLCDRLRSCDHMETHFRDRLRSCDRDRRRSQTIAEDRTMFYLRSSAINCDRAIIWKPKFCDQLRSCDQMETKVLRSAIKTYPIIFWIPTHDSTLLSNKAREFACSEH